MNVNKTTPHIQSESYETWQLYQELLNIPGNRPDINTNPGVILTTEFMHGLLNTAYKFAGYDGMDISH
jgi:hypothetical protein